ncbi:MAG: F0F1 ATP synthase subunit A [Candidatus Omnitrophica bacterium]|nr:F0F1 ATP synthase subunit A [Candidatus Omnitrophota bacterium]
MMEEQGVALPEFPNFVGMLAKLFSGTGLGHFLYLWENVIFSLVIVAIITLLGYFASRNAKMIPGRLQNAAEVLVESLNELVSGMIGEKYSRKYLPFLGTLFIYILFMNLFGLIPFMKSATSSLSTTVALAICVFVYVTYTAIRHLGFIGYIDHLAGKPRGVFAITAVLPIMMFILHTFSELVRPITLSLRLRSNIWGDDLLLALFAGFGLKGFPLLFFNSLIAMMACVVQAVVFALLSTIYFGLVLNEEDEEEQDTKKTANIKTN